MAYAQPNQTYQSNNDLLTLEEAADYTGYSRSRIGEFTRNERLPYIKRGRRKYVRRQDLDALFSPVKSDEDERLREIAREIAALAPELDAERKARFARLLDGSGPAC